MWALQLSGILFAFNKCNKWTINKWWVFCCRECSKGRSRPGAWWTPQRSSPYNQMLHNHHWTWPSVQQLNLWIPQVTVTSLFLSLILQNKAFQSLRSMIFRGEKVEKAHFWLQNCSFLLTKELEKKIQDWSEGHRARVPLKCINAKVCAISEKSIPITS